MNLNKKMNLKYFASAFLILALGIGSGEFILGPFLTVNYGFGILGGALLGISLQLFLIQIISRQTIIYEKNILKSFQTIFSGAGWGIIVSTLISFGGPGFSALTSKLLVSSFQLNEFGLNFLPSIILVFAGLILTFSESAFKAILKIEKITMSFLFLLIFILFIYFFDWQNFGSMEKGFVGIGENYYFIPKNIFSISFGGTFLAGIAYAGSGGNLLLANSFYVLKENNNFKNKKNILKNIGRNNLLFFWFGGILIIGMLSYLSRILISDSQSLENNFNFILLEGKNLAAKIHFLVGEVFVLLGALALFGVQLGILDFLGRITKSFKNSFDIFKNYSQRKIYNLSIGIMILFGLIIFSFGITEPKLLIVFGAILNAFSMAVVSLFLFFLERNNKKEFFKMRNLYFLIFTSIFYFSFFIFVSYLKFFN